MRARIFVPGAVGAALMALVAFAGPASAGGGCHVAGGGPGAPTIGGATVVRIEGCAFAPAIDQVPLGTEVTFLNEGETSHDVIGEAGAWGSETLDPGDSFSRHFTKPGLYPYSCSIHPGMAGVLIVGSPAFALGSDVEPVAAKTDAAAAETDGVPNETERTPDAVPLVLAAGLGLAAGVAGARLVARRRDEVG